MRNYVLFAAALLASTPALAQSGLEGMTVTLKIDMPATSEGVDIRPLGNGLDFSTLNNRLRTAGVGVHTGESIMITKVVVKRDHIEVQLGGGGYGTFADRLATAAATPSVPYEAKSRREKDLEDEVKYASSSSQREAARRELEDVRRDRYRDDARAAAATAQTRAMVDAATQAKRANAGGRFNIWYSDGVPPTAATAEGIMDALSRYVDFAEVPESNRRGPATSRPASNLPSEQEPSAATALRKGMTVAQVEQILGPADSATRQTEGSMEVTVREYPSGAGQNVTTRFVGGVLVDFTIDAR